MEIKQPNKFRFDPLGQVNFQHPKYYLNAIYETLLLLRPKYCLEIGTLYGDTAGIFQRYFEEYEPNGFLITCDIHIQDHANKYMPKECPNVKRVHVYPHNKQEYVLDLGKNGMLPTGWEINIDDSVRQNVWIIRQQMGVLDQLDFAFIDGDHTADSVEKDIRICRSLLKQPHHMLLDDVDEPAHPIYNFYREFVEKEYDCYKFENWNVQTCCALIKEKVK
jgi:hypothetical protein